MPGNLWSDADVIDIYTRRQAIVDGVLVQLSRPGQRAWICQSRQLDPFETDGQAAEAARVR